MDGLDSSALMPAIKAAGITATDADRLASSLSTALPQAASVITACTIAPPR